MQPKIKSICLLGVEQLGRIVVSSTVPEISTKVSENELSNLNSTNHHKVTKIAENTQLGGYGIKNKQKKPAHSASV